MTQRERQRDRADQEHGTPAEREPVTAVERTG
jgi:hypothetical protein